MEAFVMSAIQKVAVPGAISIQNSGLVIIPACLMAGRSIGANLLKKEREKIETRKKKIDQHLSTFLIPLEGNRIQHQWIRKSVEEHFECTIRKKLTKICVEKVRVNTVINIR